MPDGMFDVEGLLSAAGQGKIPAAGEAPVNAPPRAVIDVGRGSSYNPAAKPGEFGSQSAIPNQPAVATPNLDETMGRLRSGAFDVEGTLKAAGDGKLPAAEAPSAAPPVPGAPTGFWDNLAGSTAAVLNAIPRGVTGNAMDYLNAATQTPFRMFTHETTPEGRTTIGIQSPMAAFQEGLANERNINEQLQSRYPIASVGGQIMGALPVGMAAAPSLAYRAPQIAGMLPKIGAVASYLGRNAAFGGMANALAGGSPTTGAAVGAGAAAALPGVAKIAALPLAAVRQFAPLWSPAAREASVAATLQRDLGGLPVQTSPTGPLDLAQATGSPAVAAKVRYAQGVAQTEAQALKDAQAAAMRAKIGEIGVPASAAESSAAYTNSLRQARSLAGTEETRLWTTGKLAQTPITTVPVQEEINRAVTAMDPVLRDSMSPRLKALINRINRTGTTTVRDLNGVRSDLMQIARTSSDGAERAMANELSDAFMNGMNRVPEIVGAPNGMPTGRMILQRDAHGILRPMPEIGPPITPDPQILAEWQTARDYTRQMRTMFGQPDFASLLERTPTGAYRVEPSEGLKPGGRFFNFANGSPEGPESIAELTDFVAKLRQPGAVKLAGDMKDAARSYIAAALVKAAGLGEGKTLTPQALIDLLGKNRGWFQSSGLLGKKQIDAANELLDYASRLRQTERLNPQGGSATQSRQVTHRTFIDEIMHPWVRRIGELAIAAGAHFHGESLVGGAVAMGSEAWFRNAETAMRELMASAVLDSRVASDLMMRASQGNSKFLSPQTRELLGRLRLAIQADIAPQVVGGALPAPVEVRH